MTRVVKSPESDRERGRPSWRSYFWLMDLYSTGTCTPQFSSHSAWCLLRAPRCGGGLAGRRCLSKHELETSGYRGNPPIGRLAIPGLPHDKRIRNVPRDIDPHALRLQIFADGVDSAFSSDS